MDHTKDHFAAGVYGADVKSGPFGKLNPTRRLARIPPGRSRGGVGQSKKNFSQEQSAADHHVSNNRNGDIRTAGDGGSITGATPNHEAYYLWSSRNNRKGRHAVYVKPASDAESRGPPLGLPRPSNAMSAALHGILKMVLRYPVYDVSYDVATIFTLGSVVWVINGFFVFLPFVSPATEFSTEVDYGGGITAFVGATIFVAGSILLMLEAVNENRSECFGWALAEAAEEELGGSIELHKERCTHHHANPKSWLVSAEAKQMTGAREKELNANGQSLADAGEKGGEAIANKGRTWQWWPSWYELKTHYIWDIGFLACSAQMFGASVFWVAGLTGLPGIYNVLTVPQENVVYWTTQVVGGTGFIVSGILFMLETQPKWYIPAPNVLGWHIGLWNLIGAFGFTLCGALGYGSADSTGVEYASLLSTFIGSWAFLIGSVIQWYESLDKYPVSMIDDDALVHAHNRADS